MVTLAWREILILACVAGLWLFLLRDYLPGMHPPPPKGGGA